MRGRSLLNRHESISLQFIDNHHRRYYIDCTRLNCLVVNERKKINSMKRLFILLIGLLLISTMLLSACAESRSAHTQSTPTLTPAISPTPTPSSTAAYNIEQAISDQAQQNTIAFDALGFITGNLCSDSFLPPGKVSDFFGFQYLRDNTADGMGHNTDFVTNCANGVLYILDDSQKAQMIALAGDQVSTVNDYAYKRFPLMEAFRRLLEGDIPAGSSGLNRSAVMAYSAELYMIDANISMLRAELFGSIIKSLNESQRAYLDSMVQGGFASWPVLPDQVDKTSLSHDEHVLVMTYASEMFGWYAGSIEADTYFCPERQGDYFGGFYIKDAPAIGNAGYTINETITGNSGENFLEALNEAQAKLVTDLVNIQRDDINDIVAKRQAIATELRLYLTGSSIDQDAVLTLAARYGELDGEISYYYATNFAEVAKTLTSEQQEQLMQLRGLEEFSCDGAYLYSGKIAMPEIMNTDFLFEN